jgi:hypothetical protein
MLRATYSGHNGQRSWLARILGNASFLTSASGSSKFFFSRQTGKNLMKGVWFEQKEKCWGTSLPTADSRKGWGQLVPDNFQSGFILTEDGPSPPLLVRILESAVHPYLPGAYPKTGPSRLFASFVATFVERIGLFAGISTKFLCTLRQRVFSGSSGRRLLE